MRNNNNETKGTITINVVGQPAKTMSLDDFCGTLKREYYRVVAITATAAVLVTSVAAYGISTLFGKRNDQEDLPTTSAGETVADLPTYEGEIQIEFDNLDESDIAKLVAEIVQRGEGVLARGEFSDDFLNNINCPGNSWNTCKDADGIYDDICNILSSIEGFDGSYSPDVYNAIAKRYIYAVSEDEVKNFETFDELARYFGYENGQDFIDDHRRLG